MTKPLILMSLLVAAAAPAQFNDAPPLFPTPPVVGVDPGPLTNFGRTNLYTGSNSTLFTNNAALARRMNNGMTNGAFGVPPGVSGNDTGLGNAPGLTNSTSGGFGFTNNNTPGLPPGQLSLPAPPQLPTLPGTGATAPGVPPANGQTPGVNGAPVFNGQTPGVNGAPAQNGQNGAAGAGGGGPGGLTPPPGALPPPPRIPLTR